MKNQPVAIVTGGASGIGLAIVETFVKNKIKTIVIGRDQKKLKAVKLNKCNKSLDLVKKLKLSDLAQNNSFDEFKTIIINKELINTVKDFIINKKRKLYGGFGLNKLIEMKNPKDKFFHRLKLNYFKFIYKNNAKISIYTNY